jgi:hypothetical protein
LQLRLFVLDPFVRVRRIEKTPQARSRRLPAYLRELQRRYGVAVIVVHDAKKGVGRFRTGLACAAPTSPPPLAIPISILRRSGGPTKAEVLNLTVEHSRARMVRDNQGENSYCLTR